MLKFSKGNPLVEMGGAGSKQSSDVAVSAALSLGFVEFPKGYHRAKWHVRCVVCQKQLAEHVHEENQI